MDVQRFCEDHAIAVEFIGRYLGHVDEDGYPQVEILQGVTPEDDTHKECDLSRV